MNQNSSAVISLIVAAIIILLVSVVAYFIGGKMAEMFILENAQNVGIQIPEPTSWKGTYYYLVQDMGLATAFILLLWTALTHWGLRSEDSGNHGKLWLWLFFGIIVAIMCVVIPIVFVKFYPQLIIDESIHLLFFVCYAIFGYWGGSIIVTSDKYKYTPLLARFFR